MLPPAVPDFVPEQVPPKVALARVTLVGRLSVRSLVRVATLAISLCSVIVSVLFCPGAIVEGLNALVNQGAELTVNIALAGLAFSPRLV